MKDAFSDGGRALAWLQQQVQQGHGGKVLLTGFEGDTPRMAWAAGLSGEQDHANFVTFARFALHKLGGCDGYWLFLPTTFEDCLGYRLELRSESERWQGEARWPGERTWQLQAVDSGPLLDDLLLPGASLPGLMRRDLTQLAHRLQVDPPV